MIKNFYYSVWADCILQTQKAPAIKGYWKFITLFIMSLSMGFNYGFIMVFLPKSINPLAYIRITIFQVAAFNDLLNSIILYILPSITLNYFVIFHKNKYKQITLHYKFRNGQLFKNYFLISLWVPIITLVIAKFLF